MHILFGHKYKNLNKIVLSESKFIHNHREINNLHPEAAICPVLKSNAYGHGIIEIARIATKLNPEYLIVDSLFEAYELQKNNINSKILILGYTIPENYSYKRIPFDIAVFDIESARALNKYQRNCNIHIFLDTGMNREGVCLHELDDFVDELSTLKNVNIVGLCSHFADADNSDDSGMNDSQIKQFEAGLKILTNKGINPKWRHIAASAGAYKTSDKSIFNLIRGGIAHYGISPLESSDPFYPKLTVNPVLAFQSTLVQIKEATANSKVGYNGTVILEKNTKIGLVAAGYYEGVDRRLSNTGSFSINGFICRILGRVSMNMTTIDISDVHDAKVGDIVTIYSDDITAKNSIINSAKVAQTIPYELLVHLSASIRREFNAND